MQDEKPEQQTAGESPQSMAASAEERLRRAADEARRAVEAAQPHVNRAVERAKPQVERAVERAKPQVERATKQARDYAREHDTELKRAAVYLARFAVPRPLKLAFDMLVPAQQSRPQAPAEAPAAEVVAAIQCHSCSWLNPEEARYCNQCGVRILLTQEP